MSEPQELEKTAMSFVAGAVEFEKQGETEKALSLYQKAIECLNRLVEQHPKYGFSEIYRERASIYQKRAAALQTAIEADSESKEPPVQPQPEPTETAAKTEPGVDLAPILLEINRKLDDLTASVAQLKDDVVNLRVNVNDIVAKAELSQKEVAEIRNLVYSIKYDR
jgi:tetratricopeptide (TPR) repeat protein